MKYIAIVGSREYPRLDLVRAFVESIFRPDVTLLSGGAPGVDTAADEHWRALMRAQAGETRIPIPIRIRPRYIDGLNPKLAPLARNYEIAIYCNEMHAFWDGKSRGTENAIGCAVNLRRLTFVNLPPPSKRLVAYRTTEYACGFALAAEGRV